MQFTLRQAAEWSGKSKSTIQRALKKGDLSGGRNKDGSYAIDASELSRVFSVPAMGQSDELERHPKWDSAEVLELKVQMLEDQLNREREHVTDLQQRLNRSEDRVSALIAAPTPVSSKATFWNRLWGKS